MRLPWNQIGAVSGIIFVVLLIAGIILITDSPDNNAPDAEWLAYFQDDSNLVRNIIGAYLWVLAAVAFVVFVVTLSRQLRAAAPGDDVLPAIAYGAGLLFVGMLLVAAFAGVAVPAGIKFGDANVPTNADVGRFFPQMAFGALLVGGGFSAIMMIVATSVIILKTHLFAEWVAMLGFLAAILLIFAALFIPLIALPIWVLVVSGAMARRPEITASP